MMGYTQDDKAYLRWIRIIKEALSCLDKKDYFWRHLPGKGGFYDQDTFIMSIWSVIADEFYKAVRDPAIIKVIEENQKNA